MEKRFLFALFLSLLVLITWATFFAAKPEERPPGPEGATGPAGATGPVAATGPGGAAQVETPEVAAAPELLEGRIAAESEDEVALLFGEPGGHGHWRAVFSNRGARLVELRSGEHFLADTPADARGDVLNWTALVEPVVEGAGMEPSGSLLLAADSSLVRELLTEPLEEALWRMEVVPEADESPAEVRFTYSPGTGITFTKTVRPVPETWDLAVELTIENTAAEKKGTAAFRFTPAGCMRPELEDRFYVEPIAVAAGPFGVDVEDMSLSRETRTTSPKSGDLVGPLGGFSDLAFGGVHNKYFACLLRGADEEAARTLKGAQYRFVRDQEWADAHPGEVQDAWRTIACDLQLVVPLPPVGEAATWSYRLYAGPKDEHFAEIYPPHELVTEKDLGWFSGIGNLLLFVLRTFHRWFGNWGSAIIVLTICVRLLLFPLNRRSQTAMARYQTKMKRVQPRLKELKEKYANDAKKQREEQAKIMQEEGAFPPLGGCLPIFFQIPIFFALFGMLRTTFDLRQAPFALWVQDLSRSDRLLRLDLELPSILPDIEYLNVLPILMVVLWVLQQMGMPKPADEQAARMQKMMMFMPVVMGLFLYDYASGLSLYMITQSSLGIVEQRIIKKVWPVDDAELEKAAKKKGCGPFAGFAEKIAEAQKEQMRRAQEQQRTKSRQARLKSNRRKK